MDFVKRWGWLIVLVLVLLIGIWIGAAAQKSASTKRAERLVEAQVSANKQDVDYVGPFVVVPLSVALAGNGEGVIEMNRRHVVYVTRHRLGRDLARIKTELSRAKYWPGATKLIMSKAQKMEYKGLKYKTVLITPSYEKKKEK